MIFSWLPDPGLTPLPVHFHQYTCLQKAGGREAQGGGCNGQRSRSGMELNHNKDHSFIRSFHKCSPRAHCAPGRLLQPAPARKLALLNASDNRRFTVQKLLGASQWWHRALNQLRDPSEQGPLFSPSEPSPIARLWGLGIWS